MEIRKSNSVVSTVPQESSSSESTKSDKSLARGISSAKDSFEVSSSSNQENSGKKELGAAQQEEASKMNYKDFGNNGTTSQNSRPTYEDAKNSGLSARLGHNKEANDADSKNQLPNGVTVADIKNSQSQTTQTSDAVNDAQQKLNGGGTNYRESLEQELAQRRSDFYMMGGSAPLDRARNSTPDPTATPKGKGTVPTGADQVAYGTVSERKNKDGSVTQIFDEKTGYDSGQTTEKHGEFTVKKDGTMLVEDKETSYFNDNSKEELDTKNLYDAQGNLTQTVTTDKAYGNGKLLYSNNSTTTYNKDGSSKNVTTTKETQSDGSTKTTTTETTKPPKKAPSYGYDGAPGSTYGYMPGIDDRYSSSIPEDIKKQIEYDMQQVRNSKPKTGGETELTDGGVTGNSADGSIPVNDAFTRSGGVMGAVAQPTRAGEYVGNPSNVTVGSAIQNGGATDPVDGNNWTGTTHQDDPADVQFGPQTPVAGSVDSKKTDKNEDSDSSVLDQILNRKTKKSE